LAKKEKPAPDLMQLIKRSGLLREESDRGCALVATAWIDDSLTELVRSRFVDDRAAADELLDGDTPLATFSAKIKLLYCMGVINKEVKNDLDIIRAIRNLFAHDRDRLGFDTPTIKDRCRNLSVIPEVKSLKIVMADEPRDIFTSVSVWLVQFFLNLIRTSKRPALDKKMTIEAYFERIRAGQRRRQKEWEAQQEH
jgi:DNA-binding MltR family transcriptional regulator